MIDQASFLIAGGQNIAAERIEGADDNMIKSHYHEYFELYYLEYGHRYHIINDELYSLKSGEFIMFPPYVMHHSYADKNVPFKRLLLYFKPEIVINPKIRMALNYSAGVYKLSNKERQKIHSKLTEILSEQNNKDTYWQESMEMIVNQIVIELVRHTSEPRAVKPEKQTRIMKIINYLHLNYAENIVIKDLAAKFYISPYYLCRKFKKYTNSTIIQYVNNLRIIKAQRLLMETDKSITDISVEVGFSNVTHFGRVFKSVTGTTPSRSRSEKPLRLNDYSGCSDKDE